MTPKHAGNHSLEVWLIDETDVEKRYEPVALDVEITYQFLNGSRVLDWANEKW